MNEGGQCQTTKYPQLIACTGSKTVAGEKIAVIFMIPITESKSWYTDKSELPIHARCEFDSKGNSICAVDEFFTNGLKASAPIPFEKMSKEEIFNVRTSILEKAQKLMFN